MKTIILNILVYFIFFSQDYTINGYVKDSQNSEDLIAVNVYLKNTSIGSVTNEYGYYSITVATGTYTIVYNYLGYDTKEIQLDLNSDTTFNVELAESVLSAEEIIITAEREDKNVKSIEMSVAELDISKVKQAPVVFGEVDPIKTLKLLPGVSSATSGSNGFSIRGGSPDQNLILLDEAVIFNASHLFGFFSVFNADAIKDFKLYKGGIHSKYGGRLSSVLDIRQKEGNKKDYEFNAGIGLISSRFVAEGPLFDDDGSFLVAARRSYADIFLALTDEANNTAFFYDLNLKTNYQFDDENRLFLSGYFGRDKFSFVELFGNSWGNSAVTMRYNHLFSKKLFSNTSIIYSDYDYESEFYFENDFRWFSNVRNLNFKQDFSYYMTNGNELDFGLQVTNYSFNPGEVEPINGSSINPVQLDKKFALEPSIYASFKHNVSEKLQLLYGFRLSAFYRLGDQAINQYANGQPVVYNSNLGRYENGTVIGQTQYDSWETIRSFMGLEPRFGLNYSLGNTSSLKLSYNKTRQYLQLLSNASSSSPTDIWAPSGSFIEPSEADQFAIGYFSNFDDNDYEFSIETYYKKLSNQLDFVPGADLRRNNAIETELLSGDGRSFGLELLLRKNKGDLTGWLAYTYSKTEKRIPGLTSSDPGINNGEYYPSAFDKPHNFTAFAVYDYNENWTFSGNLVLTSGRPTTYPASRYQFDGVVVTNFESINRDRLPAETRLDIGATLKDKWGGDWTFSIYNVLNIKNTDFLRFQQVEFTELQTEAVRFSFYGIVPSITFNFEL